MGREDDDVKDLSRGERAIALTLEGRMLLTSLFWPGLKFLWEMFLVLNARKFTATDRQSGR